MFIFATLQCIFLMNIAAQKKSFKYLAFIIIDVINSTCGLAHNDMEYLLFEK